MKSQKKFWIKEFENKLIFPGIHDVSPSTSLVTFEKYFPKPTKTKSLKVLDLGCGNGKNAIYLSDKGYSVTAVDFAENAVSLARINAGNRKINFFVTDIGKQWENIKNPEFDILIDIYTTICIPEKGRNNVIKESARVLKPGGFYLFCGVGRTPWCDSEPGPEVNSTVFPYNGKYEKQYTKDEMLETFGDFKVLKLEERNITSEINKQLIGFPILTALFKKR